MVSERRQSARHMPGALDPISRIRVRAGRDLMVVDVSQGGALVEGDMRLLPGTDIDVHVMTAGGRTLVRSRIVRAYVAAVASDRIVYRGALAFERPVDIGVMGMWFPAAEP